MHKYEEREVETMCDLARSGGWISGFFVGLFIALIVVAIVAIF